MIYGCRAGESWPPRRARRPLPSVWRRRSRLRDAPGPFRAVPAGALHEGPQVASSSRSSSWFLACMFLLMPQLPTHVPPALRHGYWIRRFHLDCEATYAASHVGEMSNHRPPAVATGGSRNRHMIKDGPASWADAALILAVGGREVHQDRRSAKCWPFSEGADSGGRPGRSGCLASQTATVNGDLDAHHLHAQYAHPNRLETDWHWALQSRRA
jgi:hypothetical protein